MSLKKLCLSDIQFDNTCAVLTGSHVYGVPHEDSDVDLAILVSKEDFDKLVELFPCDGNVDTYKGCPSKPLRIGKLNLLLCTSKTQLDVWRIGTDTLKEQAPVDRNTAKDTFRDLRKEFGV